MSEFHAEFVNTHHHDVGELLDLAQELPLTRPPDVALSSNPHTEGLDAVIDGITLDSFESGLPEGSRLRIHEALVRLQGFTARACIRLVAAELQDEIKGASELSEEEEAAINRLMEEVHDYVEGGVFSYAAFEFIDAASGDAVQVSTCSAENLEGSILARELTITTTDTHVKRSFSVSDLPVTFDGVTAVDVRQTVTPVEDEVLQEAAKLFEDNNTREGVEIIVQLFTNELAGSNAVDENLAELQAKYAYLGKAAELQRIIEKIKLKAQTIKANTSFYQQNPEMALPSTEELRRYKELLSGAY